MSNLQFRNIFRGGIVATNACEEYLKISGWSSSYSSVNNLLRYLRYRRIGSEKTRCNYCRYLYGFSKYAGSLPDDLIVKEKADVEKLLEEYTYYKRANGWNSARTANTVLFAIGTFFKINGFKGGKKLDIETFYVATRDRTKPEYIPTLEEARRMADVAGCLRNRAIILFLCFTGLRNSTLRALQYGSVREEVEKGEKNLLIRVTKEMKNVVDSACKRNSEYFTFTSEEATEALRLYIKDRRRRLGELRDDDILFCAEYNIVPRNRRGNRTLTARELEILVKEAARKAGLKEWNAVYPHCLRKTYDSVLRMQFADGGRLDYKTQEFFMGRIVGGSAAVDTYVDKTKIENMRKEYAKLVFKPQEQSAAEALKSLQAIAVSMGVDYSGLEEARKRELGRMLSDEERLNVVQEAFRRTAEILKNFNGLQHTTVAVSPQLPSQTPLKRKSSDETIVVAEDTVSVETWSIENHGQQVEPLELPCCVTVDLALCSFGSSQFLFSVLLEPHVIDSCGGRGLRRSFHSVESFSSYIQASSDIVDVFNGNGSTRNDVKDFVRSLPSTLNKLTVFRLKWDMKDVRFTEAACNFLKAHLS